MIKWKKKMSKYFRGTNCPQCGSADIYTGLEDSICNVCHPPTQPEAKKVDFGDEDTKPGLGPQKKPTSGKKQYTYYTLLERSVVFPTKAFLFSTPKAADKYRGKVMMSPWMGRSNLEVARICTGQKLTFTPPYGASVGEYAIYDNKSWPIRDPSKKNAIFGAWILAWSTQGGLHKGKNSFMPPTSGGHPRFTQSKGRTIRNPAKPPLDPVDKVLVDGIKKGLDKFKKQYNRP